MQAELSTLTRDAWSSAKVGAQLGTLRTVAKRVLGPDWEHRVRGLNRLRWITKYRLMRGFAADVSPPQRLAYILLDPELESYSYDLLDEGQLIRELAAALGRPAEELAGYAAETRTDPELNASLRRHIRWRMEAKRRMPLGSRLAWYVATRALKPELVAETGIHMGLGSLTLLRALQRNREDGHPGELISFDVNPRAGILVREQLREGWHRVIGNTTETLAGTLSGRPVGILFQDTQHTEENQRFEFGIALANAAPALMLVDCSGGHAPALEQLCEERGGSYHRAPMRSRSHIHPGGEFRFGLFRDAAPHGDAA